MELGLMIRQKSRKNVPFAVELAAVEFVNRGNLKKSKPRFG